PDVELVAELPDERGVEAPLDHVRGPPLAADQRVVVEVPPEVVGEVLRPPVPLPGAADLEGAGVEDEDAAGSVAVGGAEGAHVDPVGAAVRGVGPAVARPGCQLVGLDGLDDGGLGGVWLGVDDVDARGAQARDDEVAPRRAVVVVPGMAVGLDVAEAGTAGVPAEMMELVAG